MDMHKVNPNVNIRIIGLLGMSLLFLMVDILWTKMKSFLLQVSPLDGAMWEKKNTWGDGSSKFGGSSLYSRGFLEAQTVKNSRAVQETWV